MPTRTSRRVHRARTRRDGVLGERFAHQGCAPPFACASERRRTRASDARSGRAVRAHGDTPAPRATQHSAARQFDTRVVRQLTTRSTGDNPARAASRCGCERRRRRDSRIRALVREAVAAATTGNRGHFVSNKRGSPMNAGLSFSNASYVGSRVPDWVPNRHHRPTAPRNKKTTCHRGFRVARPGLEPGTPRFSDKPD